MIRRFLCLILLGALVISSGAAYAETLTGRVIGVQDGDTIKILDNAKHPTRIRLAEIDAPEKTQPFGMDSKKMLSDLVFDKEVTVEVSTIDKYGRSIGRVYQGDNDVNLTMVKQGGAWAYRQYLTDEAILTAETTARASGEGLWALQEDQRMPPWEWRHGRKPIQEAAEIQEADAQPSPAYQPVPAVTPTPSAQKATVFTCAGKTACGQMASCAEAMFYLSQCGLSRLDRNHDGIPCESICK